MDRLSSVPSSLEALESMIIYLVEAVSRDYNISMEAAKPKALELLYESSAKLLGSAPVPQSKQLSGSEFKINVQAVRDSVTSLNNLADNNNKTIIQPFIDRIIFHLKKLEQG